MNWLRNLVVALIALPIAIAAQTQQSDLPAKVRVEITTDKTDYGPTEFVKFRVSLVNQGYSAVYVAKTWSYAGGGIAGFGIDVKQLTGKRSGTGCGMAGDALPSKDGRTPEQILREDFVRLGKGELVGFEDVYNNCVVRYPGTYQMIAYYSASNFNTKVVSGLTDAKASVIEGRVQSKPFTFRVHANKHPLGK